MYKKKWAWVVTLVVVPVIFTAGYFLKKDYTSSVPIEVEKKKVSTPLSRNIEFLNSLPKKESRDPIEELNEIQKVFSPALDSLYTNNKERVKLKIRLLKDQRERDYQSFERELEEYRKKHNLTEDVIQERLESCYKFADEIYEEQLEKIRKENRFIFDDILNEVNSE